MGAFRRLVLDDNMVPSGAREPVGSRCFDLQRLSLDGGFDALADQAGIEVAAESIALSAEFVEGLSFAQAYAPARSTTSAATR